MGLSGLRGVLGLSVGFWEVTGRLQGMSGMFQGRCHGHFKGVPRKFRGYLEVSVVFQGVSDDFRGFQQEVLERLRTLKAVVEGIIFLRVNYTYLKQLFS